MKRSEAEQLIEDCGADHDKLAALAVHWIGHPQEGCTTNEVRVVLYEYVDENCLANRDAGPQPSDECDLTDPDRDDYTDSQLLMLYRVARAADMSDEQTDCLTAVARSTEALGMLDDLQARIGIAGDILAPARAILRDISGPENPVAILCDVLRAWQDLQGLAHQCADEQRTTHGVSPVQRAWLDAYCDLWNATNV